MNSPILPGRPERGPTPPPRVAKTIWLLRTLAALVGLIASIVGLTHNWHARAHAAAALPALTSSSNVWWGDVADGRVCIQEIRASARDGDWRCVLSQPIAAGTIGRSAHGRTMSPCSHRLADQHGGSWVCLATADMSPAARRYAGGIPQPIFGAKRDGGLCIQERRSSSGAPWTCVEWGVAVKGTYFAEAAPAGQVCLEQWADQDIGAWACGQRPW